MVYYKAAVILTDQLKEVIDQLEPYTGDYPLVITSAKRNPSDQLRIIAQFAHTYEIKFEEMNSSIVDATVYIPPYGEVYRWTRTWSEELHRGIMINPPLPERCLFDYKHPTKGLVKAGTVINPSPHFKGTAFDISGGGDVPHVISIIEAAMKDGIGIKDYLIERENNCVHVDIKRKEI